MTKRPDLDKHLNSKIFRENYYLKEELISFCRQNGLPTSGNKLEITERVALYLETGRVLFDKAITKKIPTVTTINEEAKIEADFICSERHRAFFKEHIGKSFSFNVTFQKWLKENSGKTYKEAISAYHQIIDNKKEKKPQIQKQFEYNAYIRDFFADNSGKTLKDAIRCWKYKRGQQGLHRYERLDLEVLK